MSIDDPISALEELNRSDELLRSPLWRFSSQFLQIVKLLSPPGIVPGTLEIAAQWFDRRAESNREEFAKVFAGEIRYCRDNVQKLLCENEAQRRFVEDELPGLTLDALRRAEQCRTKERIGRLARILTHAASKGSHDGADRIEDMMSVAARLPELDLLVLKHATLEYRTETSSHPQEAQRAVAERAWRRVPHKTKCAISEDELITIGSRLESFGLATQVETGREWELPVFRPLEYGYRFIEYIQSSGTT
ncbi:MAG TPA: hypothetical protein VKX49_18350 [Bryobacteraceae bacterium]|nr:hypothetical protein [Bryobacteraceae bacterium]